MCQYMIEDLGQRSFDDLFPPGKLDEKFEALEFSQQSPANLSREGTSWVP